MLSSPRTQFRRMGGAKRYPSIPESVTMGIASLHHPTIDVTSRSRGAVRPRFASRCPSLGEGAGKTGCSLHPRSRVPNAQTKTHTSIQVQRKHSGLPCAVALRLMPCSPRRRIRLVTVDAGFTAHQIRLDQLATDSLAPATGVGTTRFCRTHQRRSSCAASARSRKTALRSHHTLDAAASTASHPASVTIAKRPSPGWDGPDYSDDLPDGLSGIFLRTRLDNPNNIEWLG